MALPVTSLSKFGIFGKLMGLSVLTAAVVVNGTGLFAIPTMRNVLWGERQAALANLVDSAYSTVERYGKMAERGEMSRADAQTRVLAELKALRYGKDGYFWINDLSPRMVMHPVKPELDGKDLSDNKDPTGKRLFVEMVQVCKTSGAGFVAYSWPKPGASEASEKISYVRLYAPWGWIVGTGVYADDVSAMIWGVVGRVAGVTIFAGLLALLASAWLARKLSRSIRDTAAAVERIAAGDLTARAEAGGADEIGEMADSVNSMAKALRQVIGATANSVEELAGTARTLAHSTDQIRDGSQLTSDQARSVASAAEEMGASVGSVAADVLSVSRAIIDVRTLVTEGFAVVERTAGAIGEISLAMREAADAATELGQEAGRIETVVNVIDDIADQTNLLALNAAIEAARAGEHGRGFAVVADEVRKLSEKTAQATRQVVGFIGSIQAKNQRTSASMEQGLLAADKGARLGEEAGRAMAGVEEQVGTAANRAQQIAAATEQMSATVEEIASSVEEIHHGAERNAMAASEIFGAAALVSQKADANRAMISHFTL